MAPGKGFQGILGVKKEAAYATALAVTEALPFVSEDFGNEVEKHVDEVLRGKAGAGATIAGNKSHPFTIPCKLTYEDLDLLIAMAMGSAGAPVANGALYDNTYSLAEDIDHSLTAAVYKGVSVWEFAGCKINTMKISGSANKPLDIEFGGAAKVLDLASALNTSGVMTALDTEDAAAKVMFSDLTFKIAAQATDLAGVSEVGIGSFDLSLDNKLKMDEFDNRAKTILEPQRDGIRSVPFNFAVPRYEADTYIDWRDNDTALHAQLAFTMGDYLFQINIPKIKVDQAEAKIPGPGLIQQAISCTCFRDPGSASATFTVTDEFEILTTNGRSASPLA